MSYYCDKCKTLHTDDTLCPIFLNQIKKEPELLAHAIDFISVSGQYALVSTQALDKVYSAMNSLCGTNISFEGSHQFARDIHIFNRLNEEAFCRSGAFSTPLKAKEYVEKIMRSTGETKQALSSKLTGYSQEVDWIMKKKSQISSIWEESHLLNNNAKGVDGITINRFTGKTINRTTVKATADPNSIYPINSVKQSISRGYTTSEDIICSTEGACDMARQQGLRNPVIEINTSQQVNDSNDRLTKKILDGQAKSNITTADVLNKSLQGAIIGAAIGLTVSSITSYMRYINGEITKEEAFLDIGEDTVKSAITGGVLSGVTLFLPSGVVGFVGGMAIGVYVNAVCKNILDEVFGKGAYMSILASSGCIMATCSNLADAIYQINQISQDIKRTNTNTDKELKEIDAKIKNMNKILGEF